MNHELGVMKNLKMSKIMQNEMKILNNLSSILIFSLLVILSISNLINEFDIFSFISLVILILFLIVKLLIMLRSNN